MCTLIAIHRAVPGRWLVVAANRDEFLDRPAEGPAVRRGPAGRILAPLDARAGGTWLGLNDHGVFAALTNLRTSDPDPTRKSRGMVVMDALALCSADAAAGALARLSRDAYNGFNCFVADREAAYLVTYRDRPSVHALAPGVHVVGNADASATLRAMRARAQATKADAHRATASTSPEARREGADAREERADERDERADERDERADERDEKVQRVLEHARIAASGSPERVLDRLAGISREHGRGRTPLGDTCVHVPATHSCSRGVAPGLAAAGAGAAGPELDTYGTRSSLLMELADAPGAGRLLYADGAPCRTPYMDLSSLLIELGQSPGFGSAESSTRATR